MKRLFVSAAVLPLLWAAAAPNAALAETKISTATTTPVRTSTLASGQPDSLLIEAAGSIAPTASGAAVTMDAVQPVTIAGGLSFTGVNNAVGVVLVDGGGGALTLTGTISLLEDYTGTDTDSDGDLDGPFAQGSGRYGIRLTSAQPFTGSIVTAGAISIEGNDSAGISLEAPLVGTLNASGSISMIGDRVRGVSATSVSGEVRVQGAVAVSGEGAVGVQMGDVGGLLVIQGSVSATGYRTTARLADDARAKLDADDLKQGGAAVRITGNVGGGLLLDRPPTDNDTNNADEDKDSIPDASEGTSILTSYGGAPALDIGSERATTLGVVGTGENAYGLVNKGTVTASGVNNAVAATGLRVGQAGGGTTTVTGGINNLGGTISGDAYFAEATGLLINSTAVVPTLKNSGIIRATQTGGAQNARAVLDLSGKLALIENSGTIVAGISGSGTTGRAIAIDLSANTTGTVVRQAKVATADTPSITGEVRFGSGADRLELLGGSYSGVLSFGAGDDALIIDGGATAVASLSDTDGRLSISLQNGRLALTNSSPLAVSAFSLGSAGVLAVTVDPGSPAASGLEVAGAATVAAGAKFEVSVASLLKTQQSFRVLKAQSLQVAGAGAELTGAPFLFQAALRSDAASNSLFVDVRPKTATELGFNRSQSQAYAAVFEALDDNDALEAAVLKQTGRDGLVAIYDQMLPDHSGGSLMSAAAMSSAVSAAVGQPYRMDPEAGNGVWLQELQFQIEGDRVDASGYKSRAFGLAGGYEMQGNGSALGVTAAFATSDYHDRGATGGEQVSINLVGGGVYYRLDAGGFNANVRAGGGVALFDSDRRLTGAGLNLRTKGDWTGWYAEAAAGASYDLAIGFLHIRPSASLNYLRLREGGYQEKGGGAGFDLKVDSRTGDLLTGEALMTLGARFGGEFYVQPEISAGWRQKLAGAPGGTTARFGGGADFTLDPEQPYDGGAVVRVGVKGGGPRVLYSIEGGGTFDDNYKEYGGRASVHFQF